MHFTLWIGFWFDSVIVTSQPLRVGVLQWHLVFMSHWSLFIIRSNGSNFFLDFLGNLDFVVEPNSLYSI